MTSTSIEWATDVWNPVTGCTKVSEGCRYCYAETFARRGMGQWKGRRFEDVRCHPDRLAAPLHWRKPRRVFVNSMSDLFHEAVPDEYLDAVFGVMALAPRHTFMVLTKRPERMREYAANATIGRWADAAPTMEFRNVWLGVSIEDQRTAGERIPILLDTPASVRWVSAEPLLGPVAFDGGAYSSRGWLRGWHCEPEVDSRGHPVPTQAQNAAIDWIVVGGESGPKARPCAVDWIRSIIAQGREAGVPVFVKQLGAWPLVHAAEVNQMVRFVGPGVEWNDSGAKIDAPASVLLNDPKGGDPSEWFENLRVREFPT